MSHRALLAIRRRDGRYDCYDVPGEWPAGSDDRRRVDHAAEPVPGTTWSDDASPRRPDGDPTARGVTFDAVVKRFLDPLVHEGLVVVDPGSGVSRYAVLPYLLATADGLYPDDPDGAAVPLSGIDGSSVSPAYLRGWHHGVTEVLAEAVDRRLLSRAEALGWLDDAVRRLAGDPQQVIPVPPSG